MGSCQLGYFSLKLGTGILNQVLGLAGNSSQDVEGSLPDKPPSGKNADAVADLLYLLQKM